MNQSQFTMAKSIYCVKHEWFDEDGNKLESRCVTHAWFSSYTKAVDEYESRLTNLYDRVYPNRRVERISPATGFSTVDGTYELSAAKVYAKPEEKSCIRVALCAVDLQ